MRHPVPRSEVLASKMAAATKPPDPNSRHPTIFRGTWVRDRHHVYRAVRNLGYLLRNWQGIERIVVAEDCCRWGAILAVRWTDGKVYQTDFASRSVLLGFLDRPVFRSLPIEWRRENGQTVRGKVGQGDFRKDAPRLATPAGAGRGGRRAALGATDYDDPALTPHGRAALREPAPRRDYRENNGRGVNLLVRPLSAYGPGFYQACAWPGTDPWQRPPTSAQCWQVENVRTMRDWLALLEQSRVQAAQVVKPHHFPEMVGGGRR